MKRKEVTKLIERVEITINYTDLLNAIFSTTFCDNSLITKDGKLLREDETDIDYNNIIAWIPPLSDQLIEEECSYRIDEIFDFNGSAVEGKSGRLLSGISSVRFIIATNYDGSSTEFLKEELESEYADILEMMVGLEIMMLQDKLERGIRTYSDNECVGITKYNLIVNWRA